MVQSPCGPQEAAVSSNARESSQSPEAGAARTEAYQSIADGADFIELRRRYRGFAFPATIAFMVWYITYVACNNWARSFMDTKVVGNINIALVFGLLQFLSTFLIAFLYARHANKSLDPLATKLREGYETEIRP
jgi:uncharacterized membrane protein (DUF485 family)